LAPQFKVLANHGTVDHHFVFRTAPIVPPSMNSALEKPALRTSLPLATLSTQRTNLRTSGRLDQRMQITGGSHHLKAGWSSEQVSETPSSATQVFESDVR
jgi:hypothetical protein